jgi:hypothetical protein
MSQPAISVLTFGIYLLGQGFVLFFFPTFLLGIFGISDPADYWVRIVGLAVLIISYYYIQNAISDNRTFFVFTTQGRTIQFGLFLLLYLLYQIPVMLVGFSFFELLSGFWTLWALKKTQGS